MHTVSRALYSLYIIMKKLIENVKGIPQCTRSSIMICKLHNRANPFADSVNVKLISNEIRKTISSLINKIIEFSGNHSFVSATRGQTK